MPRTALLSNFDFGNVVKVIGESVRRNLGDALLLSGGLDTAIIAYLAARQARPECVTVALQGAPAPDVSHAKMIAGQLGLKHHVHYFGDDELEEGIRATIKAMKSFDPMEVRNSAAIYVALKTAKALGVKSVMTGDAGDELFAGYSFFFGLRKKELETALKQLWAHMRFSSIYLAKDLGIEARLPFLDEAVKSLAAKVDVRLKVRRDEGQTWGKWVLRKAFEDILPQELIWRVKAPIETGTGTTILPSVFESRIPEVEFNEKKARYRREDGVTIRDKEHLFYYEIFRKEIGPRPRNLTGRICPSCGWSVEEETSFCRTCGAYPI